ncbi:MAG: hypothetical protein AB2556_23400 [Candidatus Thiodiazotropha sp.]
MQKKFERLAAIDISRKYKNGRRVFTEVVQLLTTWPNWKRSSKEQSSWDIAGEDIFNSGKYGRGGNGGHRSVELICHNGHAWSKDLHFPQSREVHIYEGDVWQAIREATRGEPIAVWLLGGQDRQLSVDQFVLQDGRTYRTREAQIRLQAICTKLGNTELAECLRRKPRGQHCGKGKEQLEANPSQPPPRHREGLRGARSRRPLELDEL